MELIELAVAERVTRETEIDEKDIQNLFGFGHNLCSVYINIFVEHGILSIYKNTQNKHIVLIDNLSFHEIFNVNFITICAEGECEPFKRTENNKIIYEFTSDVYFACNIDFLTKKKRERNLIIAQNIIMAYDLKAYQISASKINRCNIIEAQNLIVTQYINCLENIKSQKISCPYVKAKRIFTNQMITRNIECNKVCKFD